MGLAEGEGDERKVSSKKLITAVVTMGRLIGERNAENPGLETLRDGLPKERKPTPVYFAGKNGRAWCL